MSASDDDAGRARPLADFRETKEIVNERNEEHASLSSASAQQLGPGAIALPPGDSKRLPGLDGLRALAIIGVVGFHLWPNAVPGGFLGVDLFFVISGLLITTGLAHQIAHTGALNLGNFWRRRARRIYPLLLVVVTCAAAGAAIVGGDVLVGIGREIIGALTGTTNWLVIADGADYFAAAAPALLGHLWYLAVQMQFYLVWPLILWLTLTRIRRGRWWLVPTVVATISVALMVGLAAGNANQTRLYEGTDTHAFSLMLGSLLALLPDVGRSRIARWARGTLGRLAATLAVAALIALSLTLPWGSPLTFPVGMLAACLLALIVIIASSGNDDVARVLNWKPLTWLGQRSFGIFMWHWPLLVLAAAITRRYYQSLPLPTLSIVVVLSVLLACLTRRFVEQTAWIGNLRRQLAINSPTPHRRRTVATTAALATIGIGLGSLAAYGIATAPALTEAEQLAQEGAAVVVPTTIPDGTPPPIAPSPTPAPTASPTPSPSPPPSPDPSPSPTPTTSPSPDPTAPEPPSNLTLTGDMVTAIGDSVMLGSAVALSDALPGIVIDAHASRFLWQGPDVAHALSTAGQMRPLVLIGLATNSTASEAQVEQMIAAAGSDAKVIFVNAYGARSWIPDTNALLVAAVERHPGRVFLADWQSAVQANPGIVGSDGIHPTRDGTQVYASVVMEALQRALTTP